MHPALTPPPTLKPSASVAAPLIKAGYKGSTINDVVYMGDVVNQAAHLASRGGKGNSDWSRTPRIHMDGVFQQNLNGHNQGLTRRVASYPLDVFSSDAVDTPMWDWYQANCT